MGGSGSGSWQTRQRGTVEECFPIRVGQLHRAGVLNPGTIATLEAGECFAAKVEAEEHRLVFRYKVETAGGDQWETVQEWVPISWTACHYGGRRPWFHCPRCSRRAAILYPAGPQLRLQCRRCADLSYSSQRLSRLDRIHQRADKLRARVLEGEGGWSYKPPRMHWRTFHRICDQADALDRLGTALFVQRIRGRLA